MRKLFVKILYFTIPVIFICFLLFSFNTILLDYKYAHQTSMVYQPKYSWQKYLFFSELKKFKSKFFHKQKLKNFSRLDFYVTEQNQKKLLADIPNSTKNWVSAKILKKDNVLQDIQLRLRGDNPDNWLKFKKTFRIKTRKNELINGYRRFDYHKLLPNYFIPFLVSEKMGLLSQSANIVDIFINGESNGLYVQHEKMDELFLRKNKLMPVNIYKGSNNSQERYIGLDTNLFNNAGMWTKLAYFNQQDTNDKSDLENFFLRLKKNDNDVDVSLNNFIDLEYFSKFEAFLTLLQNDHHYWRDNLRLIVDPWNGKVTQIITDPEIRRFDKVYIDFSTNDLNTYLNKNSEFIHKKYEWLYHYLKKEKLIKKISQYIDEVEGDFQIADQREPYENTDLNFSKSFRNEIDNLKRTEDKILDILEKSPNSSWSKNDTGIALVLYDYTPLHDLTFYFDKSLSPEWLGIDLNNDKKISKEEPIFYPEQNTKKINLPITLYANRIKKTDNSSKIGHDLEVNFTKTKINFISNNNSIPSRIFAKNFFTKKEFEVKQLKNNNGVMLSKFNKIIFSKEQAKPVENLGGKIFVNKDLIFNNKVSIMPGTIFEIMPGKNIIFKNKVLSLGTKDLPIIFERYEKNNKKNWGTVALLGKNTDGSIFKHTNFIGGSGGTHNQFKFTSMFSIHDTKNIKVINSNFRENEAYDDTIHIVYSKNILFEGVKVDKVYSDAIDVDISSNITFKNIEIKNSKNDGLDFMESDAVVENSKIYRSNDKGISIGEGSMVFVKNSHLEDNNIGIAVKDGSSSIIEKSNLLNNSIQVAAYAKNWQYGGGGKVKILNSELSSNQNNFDTSSDPDDKDSDEIKELVQNSKIELINSIVKGEIKIKGKNFINLKK